MKKLIIILFIILLTGITNNINAQELFGKWVLPTVFDNPPNTDNETLLLEFNENGIQYSEINSLPENPAFCEIAAGAYNVNYDLDFYILSERLFYEDENINWNYYNHLINNFHPEYQIINRPNYSNKFFTFYTGISYDDYYTNEFHYNEIYIENGTPIISNHFNILAQVPNDGCLAYALSEEENNVRYLYVASKECKHPSGTPEILAGLRKWTVTSDGVSDDMVEIINSNNSSIPADDFSAYNLEFKFDSEGNEVIVWITDNPFSNDKVFVIDNGSDDIWDIDLGRIGGIEFSNFQDNILYVSCPDAGIIALDYTNGNITDIATNDNEYGHTFLQTAPDGNIYAVSNNGKNLAQINMSNGSYTPDFYPLPDQDYIVSTYRTFDNLRYYILPENSRTYCPLSATIELLNVCPGYCDGEAWINEDDITCGYAPYQYTWYSNGVQMPNNTSHIINLCEGSYTVEIQDARGQIFTEDFEIEVDENLFDIDDFEIITSYEPAYWNEIDIRTYQKGFKISAGIDVTITNSNFYFGQFARIVIEPGASLTVNGSTLDYFEPCHEKWRGIEVAGIYNQPQRDQFGNYLQGRLILENNSVISNAENAVSLYTCNYPNRYERDILWTTSGGVVQANGSDLENGISFVNNTKSVHFIPYQNTHPITGDPMLNASHFNSCDFRINSNYIDHSTFYKHVDLNRVNGIEFRTCIFTSVATDGVSNYNSAIAAYGAGFSVESTCNMPPPVTNPCDPNFIEPSSFNGFYRAIGAYSSLENTYTFQVWDADFVNNSTGVYNLGVDNAVVVDCDFEIGYNSGDFDICSESNAFGIDIHGAIGFAFEDNKFTKYASAQNGYYFGIRVNECLSESDDIYRNEFIGLSVGNQAEGKNRSDDHNDHTGVAYLCNQNTANDYDFYVADESTIRGYIGSEEIPSGNTLTDPTITVVQFQNDYTQDIRYYYNVNETDEWLVEYSDFVYAFDENAENTCPSHYGGGGGQIELTTTQKQQKESVYAQNLDDYNNVVVLYNDLIDGGSTSAELSDIQTATPDDMWALRTQLLGDSPHLSQEVLKEMSDRTDVFPDATLLEILSANPEELREEELISYLENKEDPLPDYMITILQQVANGSSYKSVLQNQMANYHQTYVGAAQDIIRSIQHDSITDLTEMRLWLDNISGYEMDKQIIATYLHEGDFTSTQSLLDLLPGLYNLSNDEMLAYNDYKTLVELQINLAQQNRNIHQLTAVELAIITNLADNGFGDAKYSARSILEYACNQHYFDCPSLPESIGLKTVIPLDPKQWAKAMGLGLSMDPNPASTWVAFDYQLPVSETKGILTITDIYGRLITTIKLFKQQGQHVWDIREVKPGLYICTIKAGDMSISEKLIIK